MKAKQLRFNKDGSTCVICEMEIGDIEKLPIIEKSKKEIIEIIGRDDWIDALRYREFVNILNDISNNKVERGCTKEARYISNII